MIGESFRGLIPKERDLRIYGKAAVKFETRRLILSQQNSHKRITRLINEEDEKVLMEIEDFKITKNKLFKFKNVDIEIFQSELTSKYIHDIKSEIASSSSKPYPL